MDKVWLLTIFIDDGEGGESTFAAICATRERAIERLREWVKVENAGLADEGETPSDDIEEYFATSTDRYTITEEEVLR